LLLAGQTVFVDRATRYDNRAYLDALLRMIDELGLSDAVSFLGQRDDIPDLLAALDVLLVPSWEEPFGLVMVEAMAAGTPVIATIRGGPAEVIEDGRNGRLIPPHRPELWSKAVTELLSSADRRQRLAQAGRLTARQFDVDNYVAALTAIYHDAHSRRRPAGGPRRLSRLHR
jgi:glycosyltransferase involved in cell wall biosynthesis